MTGKVDDLEAVRSVVGTLQPFDDSDRERIIRWAREKLGMASAVTPVSPVGTGAASLSPSAIVLQAVQESGQDIASFVAKKDPKSDVHFAVTVAYYYEFIAPLSERKDSISKEDLIDACRKAPRNRPKRPAQVLVNAYHDGLLDRGERGQYRLNSVGENLVAMVLPGPGADQAAGSRAKPRGRQRAVAKRKRASVKGGRRARKSA
jgi:hypothetical protein